MSLFEENAAILRKMEAEGSDLGPPRAIDFSHVFPDRASADAFAQDAELQGFAVAVGDVEREDQSWDVTASKTMIPTCAGVTYAEARLNALAQPHRGRSDGWGFFRA